MTNIKKIIIFVLVLFLILIFRRKRLLENFFDEKYLDSDYMSKDVLHSNQPTNIYIEFYHPVVFIKATKVLMEKITIS